MSRPQGQCDKKIAHDVSRVSGKQDTALAICLAQARGGSSMDQRSTPSLYLPLLLLLVALPLLFALVNFGLVRSLL